MTTRRTSLFSNDNDSIKCQYGCGRIAKYLFGSKQTPQCETHFNKCPQKIIEAKAKEKETLLRKYGTTDVNKILKDPEKVKIYQQEQENYRLARAGELPIPEGQLCEYGCGEPAKFFIPNATRWCCSKQYKQCPSARDISEKKRKETSIRIYGVEHHFQAPEALRKRDETSLKRYGVTHAMKLKEFSEKKRLSELTNKGSLRTGFDKRREWLIKNLGVENVFQLEEVKKKLWVTMWKKYGGHYSKNEEWKEDYKDKTGYDHPRRDPQVEEKRVRTCIIRYGTVSASNLEETKKKVLETNKIKFGASHPFQNSNFYESFSRRSKYLFKDFVFPSGRIIRVQGYEPEIIQELLDSGYCEDDIKTGIDCPEIWYNFNNKRRRYYPDIFIPKENLVIEVKSDYTFVNQYEYNIAKREATKAAGFSFQFRVRRSNNSPTRTFIE